MNENHKIEIVELKNHLEMTAPLPEVYEALLEEGIKKITTPIPVLSEEIQKALDAPKSTRKKYVYSKEKLAEYEKRYYDKHKDELNAKAREKQKARYLADPEFREKNIQNAREYRKKQKEIINEAKLILEKSLVKIIV